MAKFEKFVIQGPRQKKAGLNMNVLDMAGQQLKRLGGAVRNRVKGQKTSPNLKKGFF